MHAWRGHEYGPPELLRWEEVEGPPLSPNELRIEVRAAGVNFPDVLFVAGTYQVKPPPPFVPGFEVSGVVCESGDASLPIGTRVVATLDPYGGYATHAVARGDRTYAIPDEMPFTDAAAMTTYQTAWFALHRRARLREREWLLVHAGAGGVGSAAIQLGKASGARVIATAGGSAKGQICRELGADVVIDYTDGDLAARVKEVTAGHGADVVFDPVGGDVFDQSTKCIAFEGRLVVIGFTSGRFPQVRANHVLVKNYSVVGLHWGLYAKHDPNALQDAQRALHELYAERKIKPLVSRVLPMAEAKEAMNAVASRATTGKVVLVP